MHGFEVRSSKSSPLPAIKRLNHEMANACQILRINSHLHYLLFAFCSSFRVHIGLADASYWPLSFFPIHYFISLSGSFLQFFKDAIFSICFHFQDIHFPTSPSAGQFNIFLNNSIISGSFVICLILLPYHITRLSFHAMVADIVIGHV